MAMYKVKHEQPVESPYISGNKTTGKKNWIVNFPVLSKRRGQGQGNLLSISRDLRPPPPCIFTWLMNERHGGIGLVVTLFNAVGEMPAKQSGHEIRKLSPSFGAKFSQRLVVLDLWLDWRKSSVSEKGPTSKCRLFTVKYFFEQVKAT